MSSTLFRFQAIGERGVIPGAMVHFRQGRAPGVIYTDKDMLIPARNPFPANGLGKVVAYLPTGAEFEVTVTNPDGSFIEQFNHTALPTGSERIIERAEPEIIETVVEVPVEVEVIKEVQVSDPETEARLEQALADLEAVKAGIDARTVEEEAPAPAPEPAENYDEPPVEIADLIDPSLTARQNLDALMAKFAAAKNMEEYSRSNGDMTAAMQHLKDAERFESGIKWNRAVLAEVV